MSKWKVTKLPEIIELIGGGTPKTSVSDYWNGEIPWLSVVDFNHGKKYVVETEKKITNAGLKNSSTKLLNKGDIIISARGTVGVIAMLSKPMTFNQSCYGIRAIKDSSTNNFIYYLLKDTVSGFKQIAHGGVFDTITRDTFDEIEILLPPLPEQRAIASVLSSLDDKIDLLHRQNQTLEKMAETLFRQWFVEEAKEDWEEGTLSDIAIFYNGKKRPEESGNVPIYGGNGILGYSNQFNHSGKSIIIGRVGAYCGSLYYENKDIWVSDNALLVKATEEKQTHYLFYFLKTLDLNSMAEGSSHPLITQTLLNAIEITHPPSDIIEKFETQLETIRNKTESNQTQIRTLSTLQDTLLPKLMSGEVRVEM